MAIFRKEEWWYVKFAKNGEVWTPRRVGMDTHRWKTKREARSAEAELRQMVAHLKTTPTSLDLLTLCNEWLKDVQASNIGHDTLSGKKRLCEELLDAWDNIPCEDVTVHMAQSYLLERAKRVSNNSFNVYRKEGRCLFAWGIKQGLLPRYSINPFAEIEKKRHEPYRPRPAAIEHVTQAYMAATSDQKDLIWCYLLTGARKSEILTWEWRDIDFDNRVYALHTRKSGTGQVKTTNHEMSDPLHEVLWRRFEKRHRVLPYVFWHRFYDRKAQEWREDRYMSLNRFTRRLCKKAGVPVFHLHQLRHLATSLLKDEAGMSLAKLQRFLRHDHQKTTEIYAGHIEMGTKEQGEFLGAFWQDKFMEKRKSSTKLSTKSDERKAEFGQVLDITGRGERI